MSEPWEEMPSAPLAAMRLSRCTNDRARDVNSTLRQRVVQRLEQIGAPSEWVQSVREFVPAQRGTDAEAYGDDLPIGLKLLDG